MPTLEIYEYELPVPVEDLERVQRILRDTDIFCAGPTAADIYDWRACRKAHADGVTVLALIDRNVLNDVVALASSATSNSTEALPNRARLGAAVMAYLVCCNIIVDPGLAVHEWPRDAVEKLNLFRRADEVDAVDFVNIALNRAHRLAPDKLPPKVDPTVEILSGKVPGREDYRLAVLKIAELERGPLQSLRKIEQFLDWTFHEYIFLPAATALAAQQFSPARSKPLLRRVSSADRQRVLSAIDNAVWDLLVASHWADQVVKQLSQKRFWILCSRDEALKALAKNLHFSRDAGQSREGALRKMYVDLWGSSQGTRLADRLLTLMVDANNTSRSCNKPGFEGRIANMIRELEQQFLA
jgi:hypothetical protein